MATIENKEFHDFIMSDFSQMFSEKRHTDGRYTFFISMYLKTRGTVLPTGNVEKSSHSVKRTVPLVSFKKIL